MVNEEDEVAFAMWTAETGNASFQDWQDADQDKWRRMAVVAIARLDQIRGNP